MTMPRSAGRRSDPAPGAYRPHVAARRPGSRPSLKPAFRVLVHRQFLGIWNELPSRVGLANAQQFWDHVAMTPGQPHPADPPVMGEPAAAWPPGPDGPNARRPDRT